LPMSPGDDFFWPPVPAVDVDRFCGASSVATAARHLLERGLAQVERERRNEHVEPRRTEPAKRQQRDPSRVIVSRRFVPIHRQPQKRSPENLRRRAATTRSFPVETLTKFG